MIKAEIIADSYNKENGARLTTFVLDMPRIVLAEFNTHRMISRNSASSRAIPFKKMLERVMEDPFIPIKWMKEHKGMQGNEYHNDDQGEKLKKAWLIARNSATKQAMVLSELSLTKQHVNRLLEPFMWHKVIATATDWENYFALRAHHAAEIHIQDLAFKMLNLYNESKPKIMNVGEWHIPFGDKFDEARVEEVALINGKIEIELTKVRIATARCARISYNNFEGKDDYGADLILHDRLLESGHWSPFEHCATSTSESSYVGNFFGFSQYRKGFKKENRTDPRCKF